MIIFEEAKQFVIDTLKDSDIIVDETRVTGHYDEKPREPWPKES